MGVWGYEVMLGVRGRWCCKDGYISSYTGNICEVKLNLYDKLGDCLTCVWDML